MGQDPGPLPLDAGLHRQSGRPSLLWRGSAAGCGEGGDARHHRRRPVRNRWFPHGTLRPDGPDRTRRELRRDPLGLRRAVPGPALQAVAGSEGPCRCRPARSQERARILRLPARSRKTIGGARPRRSTSGKSCRRGRPRCRRTSCRARPLGGADRRDPRRRWHHPDRRRQAGADRWPHGDRAGGGRRGSNSPVRPGPGLRGRVEDGPGHGRPGRFRRHRRRSRLLPGSGQVGVDHRRRPRPDRHAHRRDARERGGGRRSPWRRYRRRRRSGDAEGCQLSPWTAGLGRNRRAAEDRGGRGQPRRCLWRGPLPNVSPPSPPRAGGPFLPLFTES